MIGNALESFLYKILLTLDAIVYNLITHVYNIFDTISKINLFSNDSYQQIVERIYIILGMVMMFVLAYALLRAVINPEDFAKGETSFPKLIQNIIVSLVIIVILPTVFAVATNIQNSIINNGTIPQIILGEDTDIEIENANPGRYMAQKTFRAFFYADESSSSYDELEILDEEVLGGKTFGAYKELSDEVVSGNINYMFIISTLAGAFILYVLLNFCFDLALRAIKLMFYQIIAPIPVVCRVIPFGSLKDVFNKWVKNTVSTFVDIFIRIMVMYFGVLLVQLVCEGLDNNMWGITGLNGFYTGLIKALLIMGIVMFIRQAPKLLGDIFGIDTGNMKLGLFDKISQGGGFIAGAAIGGGLKTGLTNLAGGSIKTAKAVKNAAGARGKLGALASGIGSTITSTARTTVSSMGRSGFAARSAKNFKDTKAAALKGYEGAMKAQAKRESYKAEHRIDVPGVGGTVESWASRTKGHIVDTAKAVGRFAGIGSVEIYVDDNKIIDDIATKKKNIKSKLESVLDGEANKAAPSFEFDFGGVTYKAEKLRDLNLAIEDAKAGRSGVSVADAITARDKFKKAMLDAAQNFVLSESTYEAASDKVKAKFGEGHTEAAEFRETVSRHLDKKYVQDAGFTSASVRGDLDVTSGPMDAIGDKLDIARAENARKIAEFEEERRKREGDK